MADGAPRPLERAGGAVRARARPEAEIIALARHWAGWLAVAPAVLAVAVWLAGAPSLWLSVTLIVGLLVFGAVFAVNSSLHSYLILAFSDSHRVTMDVGFYYMANAAGRLLGTLLSGITYQLGGLALCLASAAAMVVVSRVGAGQLRPMTQERNAA